MKLSEGSAVKYLNKSYSAVDGLWFMKVEELYGFEKALDLDCEVWKVMPKIQARLLKSLCGLDNGFDSLREALNIKFKLDGFGFNIENLDSGTGFAVYVYDCPWFELMKQSKREKLAPEIGKRVCNTEFPSWAFEFGVDVDFSIEDRKCADDPQCIFKYILKKKNELSEVK